MSSEHVASEWPSVMFDTNLGGMVEDIDVDIQYFADTMLREGMTNGDMSQVTIHFTNELVSREDEDGDPVETAGSHSFNKHTIYIYVGTLARRATDRTPDFDHVPEWAVDEVNSAILSKTALSPSR